MFCWFFSSILRYFQFFLLLLYSSVPPVCPPHYNSKKKWGAKINNSAVNYWYCVSQPYIWSSFWNNFLLQKKKTWVLSDQLGKIPFSQVYLYPLILMSQLIYKCSILPFLFVISYIDVLLFSIIIVLGFQNDYVLEFHTHLQKNIVQAGAEAVPSLILVK